MDDKLKFIAVAVVAVAGLLWVGWRQPLKYRFMSSTEIYTLEHPTTPTPVPVVTPKPWLWDKTRKTMLDSTPRAH